jgi:hypothetical protein
MELDIMYSATYVIRGMLNNSIYIYGTRYYVQCHCQWYVKHQLKYSHMSISLIIHMGLDIVYKGFIIHLHWRATCGMHVNYCLFITVSHLVVRRVSI